MDSLLITSQKLGQPVPESNLWSDENNITSQQIHLYFPPVFKSQYFPVNAGSVPPSLVTEYSRSESLFL